LRLYGSLTAASNCASTESSALVYAFNIKKSVRFQSASYSITMNQFSHLDVDDLEVFAA